MEVAEVTVERRGKGVGGGGAVSAIWSLCDEETL